MKKFILMLIACLVLSSSIVYGASVIKSAYFNEGLTLAVNNSQADVRFVTVELEGEQYGRNYVSVADFVKALNDYAGLNATVDFDSKTQTIIVDANVSTPTAITAPTTTKVINPNDKITQTPDGIMQIDTWEGKQYVSCTNVRNKVKEKGYDLIPVGNTITTRNLVKGDILLIENVPTTLVYGHERIEVDYYIGTILPLIK